MATIQEETVRALLDARKLIVEYGLSRGGPEARRGGGAPCDPLDPLANSFSLVGAIKRAAPTARSSIMAVALLADTKASSEFVAAGILERAYEQARRMTARDFSLYSERSERVQHRRQVA